MNDRLLKEFPGTGPSMRIVWAVLLLAGLGVRLWISWLDEVLLFNKCVVDDAYFYLGIARNIAAGLGATFDGAIKTNGFHPVYAFLLVPIFKFFQNGTDLPLHLALTMLSIFNVLTGIVIYMAVRGIAGAAAGLTALFIWLFNPHVIMISLGGVEVGVAVLFWALCIYLYLRMQQSGEFNNRGIILLGVLTALAILSRVDAVFLFAVLTIDIFRQSIKRGAGFPGSFYKPLVFVSITFALLAPWFIWNLYHFGTIRQISGVTLPNIAHNMYIDRHQTYMSPAFIKTELVYLKVWVQNIIRFSGGLPVWALLAVLLLSAARRRGAGRMKKLSDDIRPLHFSFFSAAILVLFYALYFWGWLRPWYYLPVIMVVTVYMGVLAGRALDSHTGTSTGSRGPGVRLSALLLILASVFSFRGYTTWKAGMFPFQAQLMESAEWLVANTGRDARIGAISAGIYGYKTQRTTDLAGVVNEEAYRAMKDRNIFSYLQDRKIDYLVDREDMVKFYSRRFDRKGFMENLEPVFRFGPRESDVVVYRIRPRTD